MIAGLLLTLSCKETGSPEPELLSDREARTPGADTASPKPQQPGIPPPLTVSGEKFTVIPFVPDTLGRNGLGSGILFTFVTESEVGCKDSYLSLRGGREKEVIEITVGDLVFISPCQPGTEKSRGVVLHTNTPDGEYEFRIILGDKVFEGKIIRSHHQYVFVWPEDTPFKFQDKILNF